MDNTVKSLVTTLEQYNEAYRRGEPLVSDGEYDRLVEQLRDLAPDHPYLQKIEPEIFEARQEIRHPVPMLSTEKAYNRDDMTRFINRVLKNSAEIGVTGVLFKVTPKLDGLAGRDDGTILASRGNGEVGYDITNAFDKGVIPIGGRGLGLGEIVIVKSYFEEHLADNFVHPRNMVVGIISSEKLNEHAASALQNGVVHFVPYVQLPSWKGDGHSLISEIDRIKTELAVQTDYPLDGFIAEVVNEDIKAHMGATSHHYRWQIAIKEKGETGRSVVENILWQVGRTGNVTPVMEIRPLLLSGATIRRVTAHHAGMIRKMKIGPGAEIEIIRSGEVIPKLISVDKPVQFAEIPDHCPSCGSPLEWMNDFLKCDNRNCGAQIEQTISHWFKTLGNADWFGIKTIRKIVDAGYDSLEKIYRMDETDFQTIGFGPVQSRNLAEALTLSRTKPVEDWRFLAAFGIADLGKGDSRKLLGRHKLEDLTNLSAEKIKAIEGFGPLTSQSIFKSVARLKPLIEHMLSLGFNLQRTPLHEEIPENPLAQKRIVFTGKMQTGSREDMQSQARASGAIVQTAVSGNTDYLVCGEKVGAKKLEQARKLNVKIISETEYKNLIQNASET